MKFLFFSLLFLPLLAIAQDYPAEWFKEIPRSEAASWEVLPQDAAPGEVILSKRTELGIFSNFGATPFVLDGTLYGSIEGLWQSLKYPDPKLENDYRHQIGGWPYTRAQVEIMVGFEAKEAGNSANRLYKENSFKLVSFGEQFFDYTDHAEGSELHFHIIKRALRAKLDQNNGLWDLLLQTRCLRLRPDHKVNERDPAAYHYYRIYMELREEKLPHLSLVLVKGSSP